MAAREVHLDLVRQLNAVNAVRREVIRTIPPECPVGTVSVLSALHQHGRMRLSRLTEVLGLDLSVTSRHVALAAERGWIERSPDPEDRRSRILQLTDEGSRRLADLSERSARTVADRLADWDDSELTRLVELLTRLRESFDDHPADRGPAPPPAPTSPPGPAA